LANHFVHRITEHAGKPPIYVGHIAVVTQDDDASDLLLNEALELAFAFRGALFVALQVRDIAVHTVGHDRSTARVLDAEPAGQDVTLAPIGE
jgi:hypothetical protein